MKFCRACCDQPMEAQIARVECLKRNDLQLTLRNLRITGERRPRSSKIRDKPNLARWLVRVLRSTCHSLRTGSIRRTQSIVAARFLNCTSPGSLSDLRMMLQVFDDVFSPEIMLAALPFHARPSTLPTSSLPPPVPPEKRSNECIWPTVVPTSKKKACAKAYRNASIWKRSTVCSVSDTNNLPFPPHPMHGGGATFLGPPLLHRPPMFILRHRLVLYI